MLNKIQWDDRYQPIDCEIGYLCDGYLYYADLEDMLIEPNNKFNFTIFPRGKETQVPFHRIKIMKHKNKVIWKRDY